MNQLAAGDININPPPDVPGIGDHSFDLNITLPRPQYDVRHKINSISGIKINQIEDVPGYGYGYWRQRTVDTAFKPVNGPIINYSDLIIGRAPTTAASKDKEIVMFLPCKEQYKFKYGNCAKVAMCQAFDVNDKAFCAICMALKMYKGVYEGHDILGDDCGMTFFEIKKFITHMCKAYKWECKYEKNHSKVNYVQLLSVYNKGRILSMFDIHLSFAEDGCAYDDFYSNVPINEMEKNIPTGWWKIIK